MHESLDIGCGHPDKASTYHKRGIIGIDLERGFADIIADAEHIPFRSSCFNLVICHSMLDHVSNPIRVLREARRVSKKQVKVTVANPQFWQYGFYESPNDHRYAWNPLDLCHLLHEAGFKQVSWQWGMLDTKRSRRFRARIFRIITYLLWRKNRPTGWFHDIFHVLAYVPDAEV